MRTSLILLKPYLSFEEFEFVKSLNTPMITVEKMESNLTPNRAKDISDILFIHRQDLKEDKFALRLFCMLNKYFDSNSISPLVIGKDSLVPDGMCDLNSSNSIVYESPY